jgi:hypothetical protein
VAAVVDQEFEARIARTAAKARRTPSMISSVKYTRVGQRTKWGAVATTIPVIVIARGTATAKKKPPRDPEAILLHE